MKDRDNVLRLINQARQLAFTQATNALSVLTLGQSSLYAFRSALDEAEEDGRIVEFWTVEGYFEENEDEEQIGPWKYLCWVQTAKDARAVVLTKREMIIMLTDAGVGELRANLALNQPFPWRILFSGDNLRRAYLEEL